MNIRLLIAIGVAALLAGAAFFGYRAGVNAERAAQLAAIQGYKKEVAKLLEELDEERAKQKVVVREKIRVVKQAADPTGCADSPIPAPILEQLR